MTKLSDIFNIEYGNQADLNKLKITSKAKGVRFISRSSTDLGFQCFVEPEDTLKKYNTGDITVTLGGSYLLSAFVQPAPFYTAQNIKVLTPKVKMNEIQKQFYCYAISHNRFRYTSHGREANKTLDNLDVPSIKNIPLWAYEQFNIYKPNEKSYHNKITSLDDRSWDYFEIDRLFFVKKGKRLTKSKMIEGDTPFIGATDSNNGLTAFIKRKPIFEANTITVNYDGNGVAESYYQPKPFWALDSVNVLYPKFDLNPYIAMFLITILQKEKYRFSYGRKWHKARMEKSKIKLPIKKDGNPDWQFMEYYIKSLPYSSNLKENKSNKKPLKIKGSFMDAMKAIVPKED